MTVCHKMKKTRRYRPASRRYYGKVAVEVLEKGHLCLCRVHTAAPYRERIYSTHFSKDFQRKEVTLDCAIFWSSCRIRWGRKYLCSGSTQEKGKQEWLSLYFSQVLMSTTHFIIVSLAVTRLG